MNTLSSRHGRGIGIYTSNKGCVFAEYREINIIDTSQARACGILFTEWRETEFTHIHSVLSSMFSLKEQINLINKSRRTVFPQHFVFFPAKCI